MIRIAAYLIAHFGKSLLWTASDLLTVYALVRLRGMAPSAAGWLFFVGLLVNAAADGVLGRILALRPDWQRTLALGGLVVAAAAFPATMAFDGPSAMAGLLPALAGTILFRIAYSAYDVPHNALMGTLAQAMPYGGVLARGRTVGTALAALLLGYGLDLEPKGHDPSSALWVLAFSAAVLGALALPLLGTARTTNRHAAPPPRSGGLPLGFMAGTLLLIVGTGALSKALFHLPAPSDTLAVAQAGHIVTWLTWGRLASSMYPLPLRKGAHGLFNLAAVHAAAGLIALVFMFGHQGVLIFMLGLVMGIANLMAWMLLPNLARDAGDFGFYTMASKLASGLSGLTMAALLENVGLFDSRGFNKLVWLVAIACFAAGALLCPRLPFMSRWLGVTTKP